MFYGFTVSTRENKIWGTGNKRLLKLSATLIVKSKRIFKNKDNGRPKVLESLDTLITAKWLPFKDIVEKAVYLCIYEKLYT